MKSEIFRFVALNLKKGTRSEMEKTINRNYIFKALRIANDMSVKNLAELLRVTPAYVNAIESGRKTPSRRLIKDYSEVTGIDEDIIKENMHDPIPYKFGKVLFDILKYLLK